MASEVVSNDAQASEKCGDLFHNENWSRKCHGNQPVAPTHSKINEEASSTHSTKHQALRIAESSNPRKHFALQKFQRSSTSCTAMTDFIFRVVLFAGSGSIATTDHCDGSCSGGFDNCIHERLRTCFEFCHLKDTHRPIPNDCLRSLYGLSIEGNGLGPTIQAHEPIRNAFFSPSSPNLDERTKSTGKMISTPSFFAFSVISGTILAPSASYREV